MGRGSLIKSTFTTQVRSSASSRGCLGMGQRDDVGFWLLLEY